MADPFHTPDAAPRTVWKFDLPITDDQHLTAPGLDWILHAEPNGRHGITVWAQVDPDAPDRTKVVHIRGTGHPSPDRWASRHVATAIAPPLVWHVYQGREVTDG